MVATRSGRSEPELATAPGQQPARDTFLDDLAAEMLKEVTAVTKQYSNEVEDEDVALVRAKALEWRPGTALPALDKSQLPVKMPGASSLAKLDHLPPLTGKRSIRAARAEVPDTSGKRWYNMPAPQITEEVKRDLRMIRLRSAFDPKTFYKKLDSTKFPKYFQMGTVVESSADFYSGRLARKERKQTFAEEVLSNPHFKQVREKQYQKLQANSQRFFKQPNRKKTLQKPVPKKKPKRPKH